ncbi:MAG: hypothetical protein JSV86_10485 [Gemmatimonadota bacterium]|nr:MAG: hypothetical protein JSV86_10485 [Gemmatimonadota bacterium]
MHCPLCIAERRTPWCTANAVCWVALCSTCGVPMVVLNRHTTRPSWRERRVMRKTLVACATDYYRGRPFVVDEHMSTHPTHAHMHARA